MKKKYINNNNISYGCEVAISIVESNQNNTVGIQIPHTQNMDF